MVYPKCLWKSKGNPVFKIKSIKLYSNNRPISLQYVTWKKYWKIDAQKAECFCKKETE